MSHERRKRAAGAGCDPQKKYFVSAKCGKFQQPEEKEQLVEENTFAITSFVGGLLDQLYLIIPTLAFVG